MGLRTPWEPGIRKAVKGSVRRGHVELTCFFEKDAQAVVLEWNEVLVAAHVAAFRKAAEQFGVNQDPDLNGILKMPGVMASAAVAPESEAPEAAVLAGVEELLTKFNASREIEGETLAAELRGGMARLAALTGEAQTMRLGVVAAEFSKLKARLNALLETDAVSDERVLADGRLSWQRAATVEEELVRLKTHAERFSELLDGGGEVGRRLDFPAAGDEPRGPIRWCLRP